MVGINTIKPVAAKVMAVAKYAFLISLPKTKASPQNPKRVATNSTKYFEPKGSGTYTAITA